LKTPRTLALVGPTASGKTSLSLLVAELLNGEIVSADSRQIYKYLDIGTAKPTVAERHRVPHHFIDILDPTEEYSAGEYGQEANDVTQQVFARGRIPILVGGSGLYLKAAMDGLFDRPGKDPEIRSRLEEQLQTGGLKALLKSLGEVDPVTLKKMKEVTPRRVIRALEVFQITGKPPSQVQRLQTTTPSFECLQFGLEWPRKQLYDRINARVEEMISKGLIIEVQDLASRGYSKELNSLNTVGYKEVFDFLDGALSQEAMVDLIKRNTRRFAKRQTTWFKGDGRIRWISVSADFDLNTVARTIVDQFDKRSR
jgi:tRNA dimethylallyltransferase